MTTNFRNLALVLALAGQLAVLGVPAAAQGLRPSPELGAALPSRSVDTGPRAADFIVAVVNSEPITNNEVRDRMLRYEQQMAQSGASMPPRAQLAREVLERLITEKAQLQVAKEENIKVDDSLVDQAEANVARQNGLTVADLHGRMQAEGVDVKAYREQLRNQIMLQRLRDRELESRVKVTEQDIDHYLRDQQQGAVDPASLQLNLQHILVAVPEHATDAQVAAARAKAQVLLERARAGEDFSKLARENSDAAGAASDSGVVGMRTADRLPEVFVDAVRDLKPGSIANVIRSPAGFHIVKVLEKQQAGTPGMTVTQSHARHILLRPGPNLTEAQAVARLADFKRRIQAGQADFAQLAREYSQDASAKNGGDLGWASPGMFVPEFEEALNSLQPGQISNPIVSRFGVHLIQLVERREAKLSPSEQREIVRNLVREKKLDEAYVQWAQEVRGRAYVEYRDPPQL